MVSKINKNELRKAKHNRIRNTLSGTSERPRLNVYRSTSNIYAQIIDDTTGKTLASSSSLDKGLVEALKGLNKKAQYVAHHLRQFHDCCLGSFGVDVHEGPKIKNVVFDRGGYIYTGRVASLAEGARKAGLEF